MDTLLIEYAPILLVIIVFLIQYKIFVTPSDLSKKLDEMLSNRNIATVPLLEAELQKKRADFEEHIGKTYLSKAEYERSREDFKHRIDNLDNKLDKIDEKLDRRIAAENELLVKLTQIIINQKNERKF